MSKTIWASALAICVLCMITADALAAKGEKNGAGKKNADVTLVSGVLHFSTNETGRVTGVEIVGATGTVYQIVMEKFTQDVGKLIGKEVNANGTVNEVGGKLMLKLRGGIRLVAAEGKEGKGKGKNKRDAADQQ